MPLAFEQGLIQIQAYKLTCDNCQEVVEGAYEFTDSHKDATWAVTEKVLPNNWRKLSSLTGTAVFLCCELCIRDYFTEDIDRVIRNSKKDES